VAGLQVRWSEHEARKPYARPFGVTFIGDDGAALGSVAMSGADLLYLRQFQAAVLSLTGELFDDESVTSAPDPQRAWLDRIAALVPSLPDFTVLPESTFDEHSGREFHFTVCVGGAPRCAVDARTLLEYQDFQAAVAHQTGALHRDASVESIDAGDERAEAWMRALRRRVQRPGEGDAMAESWPWR